MEHLEIKFSDFGVILPDCLKASRAGTDEGANIQHVELIYILHEQTLVFRISHSEQHASAAFLIFSQYPVINIQGFENIDRIDGNLFDIDIIRRSAS